MKTLKEIFDDAIISYAVIGIYEIVPDFEGNIKLRTIDCREDDKDYMVVKAYITENEKAPEITLYVMPDVKSYTILEPYLVKKIRNED